jgi:hypothetical protein
MMLLQRHSAPLVQRAGRATRKISTLARGTRLMALRTPRSRVTKPNLDATQAASSQRLTSARTVAASGRIYFWQTGSLWIGKGQGRSEWHDHHAHQLALALDGEFRFRSDRSSR